jgi:anti-sigma factor RsiW
VEPYLDRALPPPERDAVLSHLSICSSCRAVVAVAESIEARLRATLRDDTPPPELWPRVSAELRALGGDGASTSRPHRIGRASRRAAIAAAALLAIGVALSLRRLAIRSIDPAELMQTPVDEMRSFVDSGRAVDFPTADPVKLRRWFVPRIEFTPPAPPMDPGLTLIGGRLCYFFERRIASYMYKADSHLVSLYIMSDQDIEPPSSSSGMTLGDRPVAAREADGFAHVLWREGQLYYSLVSDQPASRLIVVARAMATVNGDGGASQVCDQCVPTLRLTKQS